MPVAGAGEERRPSSTHFIQEGNIVTYCVGMLMEAGLVFLSDTRTNAGVDQINIFRKMSVFEQIGRAHV